MALDVPPPLRVPDGIPHVEYLLLEAVADAEAGRADVALTGVCHAFLVSRWDPHSVSDATVERLVRIVMSKAGGFR